MDPTQNNTPPAGDDNAGTMSAEEQAGWDQAGLDFLSDKGVEPDKRKEEQGAIQDEPAKPKEGSEDGKTPEANPADKKPNEEQGASDDPKKGTGTEGEDGKPKEGEPSATPTPTPEQEEAARRRTQLELDADRKTIADDVRKEMFSDVPTPLLDADGDPIETIADVMRLTNPQTGKPFTAEQAASWLMQAQRHVEKQQAEAQKEIDGIVDTMMTVKEETNAVIRKYGELLRNMPKLRARVWAEYKATLVTDEKTGIIKKAPVSMERFYSTILAPYMQKAQELKAQTEAEEKAKAEAEAAKKKKEAEEAKNRNRGDREDIFSTKSKIEEMTDPEEKGWAKAAKEYYED